MSSIRLTRLRPTKWPRFLTKLDPQSLPPLPSQIGQIATQFCQAGRPVTTVAFRVRCAHTFSVKNTGANAPPLGGSSLVGGLPPYGG